MAAFRNEEYADILYVYGLCDGDAAAAQREYMLRFPDRLVPNVRVFSGTYRRVRETGRFAARTSDSGRPRVQLPDKEEEILDLFRRNPTISTRIAARSLHCYPTNGAIQVECRGLFRYCRNGFCSLSQGEKCIKEDKVTKSNATHISSENGNTTLKPLIDAENPGSNLSPSNNFEDPVKSVTEENNPKIDVTEIIIPHVVDPCPEEILNAPPENAINPED